VSLGIAAWIASTVSHAGETRWVDGSRGWATIDVLQWVESGTFLPAALLDDTASNVPAGNLERIVVGNTGVPVPATGQLPAFAVSEVLPPHWAQPSVWRTGRHGPAAFAALGNGWEPRDFAGRPATDRRASTWDNGSEARIAMFPSGVAGGAGTPSRASALPDLRLLRIEQQTAPGQAFDVGSSATIDGRYTMVLRVISPPDGHLVFTVPVADDTAFFRLYPLSGQTP
jgi:hypothetical protein